MANLPNLSKLTFEMKSDVSLDNKSAFDLKYRYKHYGFTGSQLIHNTQLDIYHEANQLRSSGIICTIGPKSQSVEMLVKLIHHGLDVVRMNCSHGGPEYHIQTVANARQAAKITKQNIAIALDTKGPEIRTGNFLGHKEYLLKKDAKIRLTTDESFKNKGNEQCFYVDYKNMPKVCKVNDKVFIDDGLISLKIVKIGENYLDTICENSGTISDHKGVNLPNVNVDLPSVSTKDAKDLSLAVKLNVDMIFASFIRKPQDIRDVRKALLKTNQEIGKRIKIIAKIENHEGVRKFDQILKVADGIMVARGDLGIEIPSEKVFLAQKMMIAKCNLIGKPVIVATQMLDSMIRNPRPTRAEVNDVANAILDGADCVMLSGETAKGLYICESVKMMAKISREAETVRNGKIYFENIRNSLNQPLHTSQTICINAVSTCFTQYASAVIVLTNSGDTARTLAKFKPPCPVIAVVGKSHDHTARQLRITSGVYSVLYDDSHGKLDANERVKRGIQFGKELKWLQVGDFAVCVHADTIGIGHPNLVKIVVVE